MACSRAGVLLGDCTALHQLSKCLIAHAMTILMGALHFATQGGGVLMTILPSGGAMETVPHQYREPDRAARIAMIAESFERLLGYPLIDPAGDLVAAMWNAPRAILAHGTQADPVLFFGNRATLDGFETDVESLLMMPSRLTAEAPLREERQALLDRVTAQGFIDDYAGVRISATGRRFRIENAVVWNVSDEYGKRIGQAATFVL